MNKKTLEEAILKVLTEGNHVVTVGQLAGLVNAHPGKDKASVSDVRAAANRLVRLHKIATDVQDGTIRYKQAPAGVVPIDTGAYQPRDYPVYFSRADAGGWRIYRQDPEENCYHVLGQGLTTEEVGVCVQALNELALIKHRRGKTEDAPPETGDTTLKAQLAQAEQLALGIRATKARVVLNQGEHTFAYFDAETRSVWLVTTAGLTELGAMLQAGGNLAAWAEQDTTSRELDGSEARQLKLEGMEKK